MQKRGGEQISQSHIYLILSNFSMSVLTPADIGISSSPGAKLLDDLGSAGKGRDGAGGIFSCPGLRWTGLGGTNEREGKKQEHKSLL